MKKGFVIVVGLKSSALDLNSCSANKGFIKESYI